MIITPKVNHASCIIVTSWHLSQSKQKVKPVIAGWILYIKLHTLKQRISFICGSPSLVADVERFVILNDI